MNWQFLGGVCAGAFVSAAAVIYLPISASGPMPVVIGNIVSTAGLARLERLTIPGTNGITARIELIRVSDGWGRCFVSLSISKGNPPTFDELSSTGDTCESAATEVLKTMEARNVR